MRIKQIVNNLVKKYGTNDPFEIAEQKNIMIIEFDLHPDILGFYRYVRRNMFIFLNSCLDFYEKRFTCSHELGHSQLHPRINTPFLQRNTFFSTDKFEREANEFATYLLLYNENFEDYETKYDLLRANGIPLQMERYL